MSASGPDHRFQRGSKSFFLCLLLLYFLLLSSCSPHFHVVKLSKGTDEEGAIISYYAVTRNGYVIPEYVIDERGDYPTSKEEAWKRFQERRDPLEELVMKKYLLPADTPYEIQRNVVGAGLVAVSPIVAPIQKVSDSIREKKSGVKLSNRNYFENAFEEPVPKDPKLKDELSQS